MVTLPPPPARASASDQRGDVLGGATEGHVDRAEAERAKRGVLHGGREGMRDRVADQGKDPGVSVYHRTMPATRLTTMPINSWSSSKVVR